MALQLINGVVGWCVLRLARHPRWTAAVHLARRLTRALPPAHRYEEMNAGNAIKALKERLAPSCYVYRDGA